MRRILAACRRILLAGLAGLLLLIGLVFWQAPSLEELHPELERVLAEQLGLKELRLGDLSWHWAGHTWLKAKSITFTAPHEQIRVEDAQLEVRLSSLDMLRGDIRPTSISLRHGHITLKLPRAASGESFPVPSGQLHIEDSTVTLSYGAFTNRFEHLDLHLNATRRSLAMQLPGFSLDVEWNTNLQPQSLFARFDNLKWLPEKWRLPMKGKFNAQLELQRKPEHLSWEIKTSLRSPEGTTIMNSAKAPLFAFNDVQLRAVLHAHTSPLNLTRIEWQHLGWRYGENRISANADWQNGQLHLSAQAPLLRLDTLGVWAAAVSDEQWRDWLGGLQGKAKNLTASLNLDQTKPWSMPEMRFDRFATLRLQTGLSHVSIPLGSSDEVLQDLNGSLHLGADGLKMDVANVLLPHQAGRANGRLLVRDMKQPVFIIKGKGDVDVGRCVRWMSPGGMPQLIWKKAPAAARFNFSWPLHADLPDKGEARLTPKPQWQVEIMKKAVLLSGGEMQWRAGGTLLFSDMHVSYGGFNASMDLHLHEDAKAKIQLTRLKLQSGGDFGTIAAHYRMPIDGASGRYQAILEFDTENDAAWRMTADLTDAGWRRLLGSHKERGKAYTLSFRGKKTDDGLTISRIQSQGTAPFVSGNGSVDNKRFQLHITALQAPAFSGAMSVSVPFSQEPLEINIDSDFMDQAALPKQMPEMRKLAKMPVRSAGQREWVMRGNFSRIRWDAVTIRGVRVHYASSSRGIGTLEADALDAAQLSIRRVRSFFHLASGGRVDIRRLTAQMLGQDLHLSGTLLPEAGGGLRWTGFTNVSGDFSQIIHRLDAAQLFQGGMVHALWSGSGVIREGAPWWNDMRGRLRLRSDDGRILEGGTMTKLLAALSLADLPRFLTGMRKDITGPGMLYKRLQLESTVHGEKAIIRQLAMRASALDMAGQGKINLADGVIDLYITARPLQNVDSFLRMIPLLRDVILGPAKSVFRKVYHVHGPLQNAKVEAASPQEAGLPESGLVEQLISLPGRWFGSGEKASDQQVPTLP